MNKFQGLRDVVMSSFGKQIIRIIARNNLGMSRAYCHLVPEDEDGMVRLAERKPKKGLTYYYYDGPFDEKNRAFCHDMLVFDKVFSSDEINYLTSQLGYDVLKYKGSYNCRHRWVKFKGDVIYTPPPTPNQMRVLTAPGQPFE